MVKLIKEGIYIGPTEIVDCLPENVKDGMKEWYYENFGEKRMAIGCMGSCGPRPKHESTDKIEKGIWVKSQIFRSTKRSRDILFKIK